MSPRNRTLHVRLRYAAVPATALALLAAGCTSGTPESREALHLQKGREYRDKKDFRRAAVEFKVASQNKPKDPEPLYQLGMTYLRAGAAKQALETFQDVVRLDPTHSATQYELALFKVGSNKPAIVAEAQAQLRLHLKDHPDDAEALGSLALAEAKLGNKDESLRLIFKAVGKNPDNLRPAGVLIGLFTAKGDLDTAKTISRTIAETLPNSADAATLRAQVSLATKDIPDADAQVNHALELQHDFRPALQLQLRREIMKNDPAHAEQTTAALAKLPEERVWAAYARLLMAEKKQNEGLAEYQRIIKEHPESRVMRDEYSAMLMSLGRNQEAEAAATETLAKNPKDTAALMQRATIRIDLGDTEGASRDINTLRGLKALSPQLSYQQARIFAARGQSVKQGDALAEAIRFNPRYITARLELARLLVGLGKAKGALDILAETTPEEQKTPEYGFYHNMALMAAGKWDEARSSVSAALAATPTSGFYYQDALLRLRDNDIPRARKSLETGFQASPADPGILRLLGEVMARQGDTPKYAAMLSEAAIRMPGNAALQLALGRALAGLGDRGRATAAFEAARTAGDRSGADTGLALLDVQNGALDQARQRLLSATQTNDNVSARMMLAEIEARRGTPEAGVPHYLKAIELEPGNTTAMNNLAGILSENPLKMDDALFWAQKALAQEPANPVVEDTLGWILYKQAKYDAALPYLDRSLRHLDRPVAHYHLAAALLRTGDPARARREYETGLKKDPKSAARAVVAPLFESGR